MKTRLILAAAVLTFTVIAAAVWLGSQPQSQPQPSSPPTYQIRLRSDPYPMTLGHMTLLVSVEGSDGSRIDDARVEAEMEMDHAGMLPLSGRSTAAVDGAYRIQANWSMSGHWTIDVTADLPGELGRLREQFQVFIYAVRPFEGISQDTLYRSVSEINAVTMANAASEYWIIIPQGAQEMVRSGQEESMIPAEILLQANGRNTLVIRNDDIADHTIGPFYVRAGETIRQRYTAPMTLVGLCTLRGSAEIRIVVE